MSYLAQHGNALRYICQAAPLSLLMVMGCADANPATPDTPTDAHLVDSSITSFNALIRHAPVPESDALSGGETTVFDTTSAAFEQPAPNLTAGELVTHDEGDEAFAQVFTAQNGAGLQLNNPSCDGCHLGDGRGELPAQGAPLVSMLLRISIPGVASDGGPAPVPLFGTQLQPSGVAPVPREADVSVSYTFSDGHYGNGERFELRRPGFRLLIRTRCEGVFAACARHQPEIPDDMLKAVTFYVQTLGVPARRNINDLRVRLGQALFVAIGCAGCHTQTLRTRELPGVPSASNQVIHPYTDLLRMLLDVPPSSGPGDVRA